MAKDAKQLMTCMVYIQHETPQSLHRYTSSLPFVNASLKLQKIWRVQTLLFFFFNGMSVGTIDWQDKQACVSSKSRLVDRMCPFWIGAQVKHGDTPCVHRKGNGHNAQDVHNNASFCLVTKEQSDEMSLGRVSLVEFRYRWASYHVLDQQMSWCKGNGVWRGGHWEHEGVRTSNCCRYHEVQRVHWYTHSLQTRTALVSILFITTAKIMVLVIRISSKCISA